MKEACFCSFVVICFLLAFSPPAIADIDSDFTQAHGDFFHVLKTDREDVRGEYLYEPDHEENDGPGKFTLNKFLIQGEVPLALDRDTYFRIGGAYGARLYDFRDVRSARTGLSEDTYHRANILGGIGSFINDDFLLTASGTLGVYSDFDDGLNGDDFELYGEALAVYRVNPGAQVVLGVRASEDIDDTPVLPLLGFRMLSGDGKLHLSLTVPVEARLGYNLDESVESYFLAALSGEQYHVDAGDSGRFVAQVQDRHLGVGVNWWATDSFKVGLEAGVSIGSELKFKTRDAGQFSGDLEPAGYVTANFGVAL